MLRDMRFTSENTIKKIVTVQQLVSYEEEEIEVDSK